MKGRFRKLSLGIVDKNWILERFCDKVGITESKAGRYHRQEAKALIKRRLCFGSKGILGKGLKTYMGFEKEKVKQIRSLLLLAAALVLVLMYSEKIYEVFVIVLGILKPFLYGGVIAFVLNMPLCAIEGFIDRHCKGKHVAKWKRPVGIFGSVLVLTLAVVLGVYIVLPQLGKTIAELGNKIPRFLNQAYSRLEQISVDYPQLQTYLEQVDYKQIDWQSLVNGLVDFLKNGMTNMLSSTVSIAGSIIGGIVNGFISIVFALYILGQKETLSSQCRRILSAYTSEKTNHKMLKVCSLLYRNFSNFISGQCKEAVILGLLFVIAMTVFQMPYAVLVGVLIAFTALIPVVGAFIGCFVGAFLILVDNPVMAMWFVVLFLVIQQLEGNLIYPKVVGSSVGLPSIWVLAAVSIGGSLFGVAGMLVFIPLLSTVYALLRDSVNERNAARGKPATEGEELPQEASEENHQNQERSEEEA